MKDIPKKRSEEIAKWELGVEYMIQMARGLIEENYVTLRRKKEGSKEYYVLYLPSEWVEKMLKDVQTPLKIKAVAHMGEKAILLDFVQVKPGVSKKPKK